MLKIDGWLRLQRGHLVMLIVMTFAALMATPALAAELVMYEAAGCMWCRQWHVEIGPGYGSTTEGHKAPLRRHDLTAPPIAGLVLASPVTVTPTFVVAAQGRETGRITGYPGSDFFYPLLNDVLKRLPSLEAPAPGSTSSANRVGP